jgi:hypothetical protein
LRPYARRVIIAKQARHALFHQLPALNNVVAHLDPGKHNNSDHHAITAHQARI